MLVSEPGAVATWPKDNFERTTHYESSRGLIDGAWWVPVAMARGSEVWPMI